MSLFAELQRRRVIRALVGYGVAAFAVLQIAEPIMHGFRWPDAVLNYVVAALAVGFPIVVALAWIFDVNAGRVERTEPAPGLRGARLALVLVGIGVLAAAPGVAWYFFLRPGARATKGGEAARAASDAAAGGPDADDARSIAVLPFENLSDEKANAYFAAGIQDEILTRLAKIGALRVASRTSTAHFASSPDNLPAIARQLGVANILEGSVQKAGDAVHINVQLILAATDKHVWAETYDRKLDNIFTVEAEVAAAIASALHAQLTGAEQKVLSTRPTLNAAAYDAYLRGLELQHRPFEFAASKTASTLFAEAARLDPGFALAWAHLSDIDGMFYFRSFDHSPERLASARQGAEMVMRLLPDSPEAWMAKGRFLYHTQDHDGAEAAFEEARKRQPANAAEVLGALAFVARRRGNYARSNELLEQALALDPGNLSYLGALGETLDQLGQTAKSRQVLDRELALLPGDPTLIANKALTFLAEGNLPAAGSLLDSLPQQSTGNVFRARLGYYSARREFGKIISAVKAAMAEPGFGQGAPAYFFCAGLGWAQHNAGDEPSARATWTGCLARIEALRKASGDDFRALQVASGLRARLGDCEGALRDVGQSLALAGKDRFLRDGLEPKVAGVQAICGRTEDALSTLERLSSQPIHPSLGNLKFDPEWDGLRKEPRFEKLIAGAEAEWKAQAGP